MVGREYVKPNSWEFADFAFLYGRTIEEIEVKAFRWFEQITAERAQERVIDKYGKR